MDKQSVKNKGQSHIIHENGGLPIKLPLATTEQINLSKLINKPSDDERLRQLITQLQEFTKCTEDQAITALYDSGNNFTRALDLLLDSFCSNRNEEWQTTKKRSKPKSKVQNDASENGPASRSTKTASDTEETVVVHTCTDNEVVTNSFEDKNGCETGDSKTVTMNKASHYRKGPLKNRTFGNDNKGKAHAKAEVKPNVNQTNRTGAVDPNNTFWDAWDPFTDCGQWTFAPVEIVNSDVTTANAMYENNPIPVELLVDPEELVDEDQSVAEDSPSNDAPSVANSDTGEPEDLFVQQALSSRPPAAFQRPSSSPVFFYPDHPINPLKWKVKFGGEPIVPLYQSPEPAARSGSVPSPKVTHMSNASTCAQPLSDQPASITESQNISFVPSLSNQNSPSAAAAAVNYDINNKHAGVITMSIQTESNADNDVSFAADQQYKGVAPVQKTSTYVGTRQDHASGFSNEKSTEQSTYMKPMLKDYLDDLGGMSHLNIDGGKSQYGGLQASSTQTQQPTNNSPFSQMQTNTSTQHQMGKVPPTHSSIHVTHPQNVPASTQSHQQQQTAATLPPGMPHFIGQFPTPYHMFNLPGGTNSGTTLLDLEQLQFYQHLHMQQQAATTAQSYLSPPVDAPSVSKAPIHGMPTSMSHVTAANQGMRPEMLASAMSHAPQMMAAGHTYPYYPGFVLMNGYPNAFINQQQPQHHPGHDGVQGTGGSTHSSSPQSQNTVNQSHQQFSGNMKSVNTAPVSSYDDLLDLKYRDAKQVTYKNTSGQPGYGHLSGQQQTAPSDASLGGGSNKMTSVGGGGASMPPNFNAAHMSPHFYTPPPYIQAAVAAVAAAAATAQQQQQQQQVNNNNNGGGSSANAVGNIVSGAGPTGGGGGQPMHISGAGQSAMMLGSAGAAAAGNLQHHHQQHHHQQHHHHHQQQRSVLSHPQQ